MVELGSRAWSLQGLARLVVDNVDPRVIRTTMPSSNHAVLPRITIMSQVDTHLECADDIRYHFYGGCPFEMVSYLSRIYCAVRGDGVLFGPRRGFTIPTMAGVSLRVSVRAVVGLASGAQSLQGLGRAVFKNVDSGVF